MLPVVSIVNLRNVSLLQIRAISNPLVPYTVPDDVFVSLMVYLLQYHFRSVFGVQSDAHKQVLNAVLGWNLIDRVNGVQADRALPVVGSGAIQSAKRCVSWLLLSAPLRSQSGQHLQIMLDSGMKCRRIPLWM